MADITSIPTWEGVLFLAEVLNTFSRSVVGWSMDRHRLGQGAKLTVFAVIEGWYDTQGWHSVLDSMSPLAYERMHAIAS